MTIIMPTSTRFAHYTQITQVEGVDYLFRFDWNARLGRWKVSLYEPSTDAPIVLGLTVVDGWPLTMRSRDARIPRGNFAALDLGGSGIDPGFADLGARTLLFFVPQDASASDVRPAIAEAA